MSIGLDTNILARYYIEDAGDTEAQKQRERARQLVDSGQSLVVAKTVLLEFEWVMRGYYQFSAAQVAQVVRHLMTRAARPDRGSPCHRNSHRLDGSRQQRAGFR